MYILADISHVTSNTRVVNSGSEVIIECTQAVVGFARCVSKYISHSIKAGSTAAAVMTMIECFTRLGHVQNIILIYVVCLWYKIKTT